MKILILSVEHDNYSTRRLKEEIEKRKEKYEVINPTDLYAYISSDIRGYDRAYRKTKDESERIKSKEFDAIIPRVSGSTFQHALMVVKQFTENMRKFSTAYEPGLRVCSNKLTTCQILSKEGIRVPKQVLAHQPTDYGELIEMVGGLPCVGKLQSGSLGVGVFILNDELAASTSLRSFEKLGANVILQQFIDTGEPKNDIRIIVIGCWEDEPKIFAYKRYALDSDFRSNYSISKKGEKVEITKEEKEMAINASKALDLNVSGVDIMRDHNDKDKPYIIEVNGNPGLSGIEKITGEDVAGAIIDFVIRNFKKKRHVSQLKGSLYNIERDAVSIVDLKYAIGRSKQYYKLYLDLRAGETQKYIEHAISLFKMYDRIEKELEATGEFDDVTLGQIERYKNDTNYNLI